jgi:hypothetical protein
MAGSKDPNEIAHRVFLESIGELPKTDPTVKPAKPVDPTKNPHAVALGRLGGLVGGAARSAALSARKRSQIAAKGGRARWDKYGKKPSA